MKPLRQFSQEYEKTNSIVGVINVKTYMYYEKTRLHWEYIVSTSKISLTENYQIDLTELAEFFDGTSDVLYRLNEGGIFIFISNSVEALLGFPADYLIGKKLADILADQEDQDKILKASQDASGGVSNYQAALRHKNSSKISVSINSKYVSKNDEAEFAFEGFIRETPENFHLQENKFPDAEKQFQLAIDNINVGFVLWDNQQKLVSWNVQFLEFNPEFEGKLKTGMKFEELIRINSQGPIANIPEEKREAWIRDRIIEHETEAEAVFENKRSDGKWVRRYKKKLPDGSVIVMVTDITEIREQEEAARLNEERYHNVLNSQAELITQFTPDGKFTLVNEAYCRFVGMDKTELLGQSIYDAVPNFELDRLKEYFSALSPDKPNASIENSIKSATGEIRYFKWSNTARFNELGEKLEIQSVGRDITDRKVAEKALSDSEGRYRSLVDLSPDAILVLDENKVVFANFAASKLLGSIEPKDLLGKYFPKFIHPDYFEQANRMYRERKSEGRINFSELELIDLNGNSFTAEVAGTTIPWQNASASLVIFRDITERKQIDRMKTEFVSLVSHELRTPITSIMGSMKLLTGGALGKIPEKMDDMLTIAQKNAERLNALVNDILDVEKLYSGGVQFVFEEHDLNELVKDSIELNQSYAEQLKVNFVFNHSKEVNPIEVDRNRIAQVITNLLSNAAKFSPNGSEVSISVKTKDDYLRIEVSDRGPGIPDDFRETIFDRFSQVDSSDTKKVQGTGLGLTICKAIIEQHNGTIDFKSRSGGGTTFYFEIPITRVPPSN